MVFKKIIQSAQEIMSMLLRKFLKLNSNAYNKIMKRREFFPVAIIGSFAITSMPLLVTSCQKDNVTPSIQGGEITIDLDNASYSSLKQDGGYIYTNNVIVINTGNENFVALSDICTHAGCTVNYSASSKDLYCPCHGSVFSLSGSVQRGPAVTALAKYTIARTGNVLTIS
jgi:cytochrome b6-f complex iron-sulfur subunit